MMKMASVENDNDKEEEEKEEDDNNKDNGNDEDQDGSYDEDGFSWKVQQRAHVGEEEKKQFADKNYFLKDLKDKTFATGCFACFDKDK